MARPDLIATTSVLVADRLNGLAKLTGGIASLVMPSALACKLVDEPRLEAHQLAAVAVAFDDLGRRHVAAVAVIEDSRSLAQHSQTRRAAAIEAVENRIRADLRIERVTGKEKL